MKEQEQEPENSKAINPEELLRYETPPNLDVETVIVEARSPPPSLTQKKYSGNSPKSQVSNSNMDRRATISPPLTPRKSLKNANQGKIKENCTVFDKNLNKIARAYVTPSLTKPETHYVKAIQITPKNETNFVLVSLPPWFTETFAKNQENYSS